MLAGRFGLDTSDLASESSSRKLEQVESAVLALSSAPSWKPWLVPKRPTQKTRMEHMQVAIRRECSQGVTLHIAPISN